MFSHEYSAGRPRGADPVPGRHAGRHAGLVSLCGQVQGTARLPADLRAWRSGSSRCSATPIPTSPSSPTRRSSPSATTRPTASGLFFDDKDFMFQPSDFRHVGLHRTAGYILGVDPTEVPPAHRDRGRQPADRRALCLHRGAKHDPVQILEQPGRLARDRAVPQGRRLSGHLHRPEADARPRPDLEPHPVTAPRTTPATSRWPSAPAG